ncbi:MAG: tetratricopeptide repeat protein [Pseudanabaena sp.]
MKPVFGIFASVLVVSIYGSDIAIAQLRQKPPQKLQVQQQIVVPPNETANQLLERGNAYVRLGNVEGAIVIFRAAIKKNPELTAAYYNLGLAYAQAGNLKAAIHSFQRATRLDPKFAIAYSNLGAAQLQSGNPDQAIPNLQKAISLDPNLDVAY